MGKFSTFGVFSCVFPTLELIESVKRRTIFKVSDIFSLTLSFPSLCKSNLLQYTILLASISTG